MELFDWQKLPSQILAEDERLIDDLTTWKDLDARVQRQNEKDKQDDRQDS